MSYLAEAIARNLVALDGDHYTFLNLHIWSYMGYFETTREEARFLGEAAYVRQEVGDDYTRDHRGRLRMPWDSEYVECAAELALEYDDLGYFEYAVEISHEIFCEMVREAWHSGPRDALIDLINSTSGLDIDDLDDRRIEDPLDRISGAYPVDLIAAYYAEWCGEAYWTEDEIAILAKAYVGQL